MPDFRSDIRARLTGVKLAPPREAEIVEELSLHLEDRWRELVAGGLDPAEAERLTRAEFRDGNLLARYLQPLRQARWDDPVPSTPRRWFAIGGLRTDLRDAIRSLRRAPGFTTVVLSVLTLGMGATTAIFSVVDAVALRPLPFDHPEQLIAVGERAPTTGPFARPLPGADPKALRVVQPQNYLDWAAQQTVFSAIAAVATNEETFIPDDGPAENLVAQRVTAGFFDVLRLRPAIGHVFGADAEVAGAPRVVVLSDAMWRRRLSADPAILGRTISLGGERFQVVGVLPPNVSYPVGADPATEVWMPCVFQASERVRGRGHGFYLQVVARLKPGVSITQAQAGMDQIGAGIERAYPDWNRGFTIGLRPLRDHVVGASVRSWMLMLLAAVAVVLLIACANVANLMLARASAREAEIGIRAALGAGRWRLVRQFLVESVLLSLAGTGLAVIVAKGVIEILRHAMPDGVPRVATIGLDLRVLAAAAVVSIVSGMAFGMLPAIQLSRPNLVTSLASSTRSSSASRRRQRLRRALVVGEIALSVVLLVGAALFIGSFIRLMRVELGADTSRVLTVRLTQTPLAGQPRVTWNAQIIEIVGRLKRTSGVVAASAIWPAVPFRSAQQVIGFAPPGKPMDQTSAISVKAVTPDYHRALAIRLVRGRLFDDTDRQAGPNVAILDESAASHFFGADNPVGRSANLEGGGTVMIVGVVADVRQGTLEGDAMPEMYVPMTQRSVNGAYLVIRTASDPHEILPHAKAAVALALPGVPLRDVATMDERLARQTAQRRLNMLMLGLFGMLGLVISAVGVYGVMAYLVAQRTPEIGLRMALGATRPQVISMVLRNAVMLLVAGLAIGSVGAWYLSASARQFLFGLEEHDLRAFTSAVVVLSLACLFAALVPARRAASVDPTLALRNE